MTYPRVEMCAMCHRDRLDTELGKINDDYYCHGFMDNSPTCYEKAEAPYDVAVARGWL